MPSKLKNGNMGAPGGFRPGAGRKPNWFKAKMAKIADRKESLKFISDCVDGKAVDRHIIGETGQVKPVPASAQVRLNAWCEARDTGYGKPTAAIEVSGLEGVNLTEFAAVILGARQERALED